MDLAGARIVVTGASRGIGAQLATALASRGARVVLVARSRDAIARRAEELGGEAFPADLGDAATIEPLVRAIEADGPIDVLVNNAGVDLTGPFTELDPERIRALLAVNLVAPMLLCRQVLPAMIGRGRGHIMNVSSLAGTNALPGLAPYSASKAGLSHFTAGLRAECKGTGITTTLAEIGPVESDDDAEPARPPGDRAGAPAAAAPAARGGARHGRRGRPRWSTGSSGSGGTCGCRREMRCSRS